jgi:hypothetical protein
VPPFCEWGKESLSVEGLQGFNVMVREDCDIFNVKASVADEGFGDVGVVS